MGGVVDTRSTVVKNHRRSEQEQYDHAVHRCLGARHGLGGRLVPMELPVGCAELEESTDASCKPGRLTRK